MEARATPPALTGLPSPSRRVLVLVGGGILLASLLWIGRDILAPFVVGLLVVYLLDPIVERLARIRIAGRRVPRAILILVVYGLAIALLVELFLLLVGPLLEQIQAFARDAPGYVETLSQRLGELFTWWDRLALPADIKEAVDGALQDVVVNVGALAPSIVRPIFSSFVGLVGSVFGYLIIPVWAFWILKDRPAIVRAFDRAVPAAWRADTWVAVGIVRRVFGSWVRGQVILGLIVGIGTFFGLLALGAWVDPVFSRFAVLLAVIAGVLELLPIIGPIIAAVPAVLLGATVGVPGIVAALALYVTIQQVENTILVPKIQGDATALHPALVIFALILGGAIAGLLGAILALPVAATLRDLYVYAFRRADGLSAVEAATGMARAAAGAGPAGIDGAEHAGGTADEQGTSDDVATGEDTGREPGAAVPGPAADPGPDRPPAGSA